MTKYVTQREETKGPKAKIFLQNSTSTLASKISLFTSRVSKGQERFRKVSFLLREPV